MQNKELQKQATVLSILFWIVYLLVLVQNSYLSITFGLMYVKYFDNAYEIQSFKTELSKKIFMFSLGATYKLPL